MKPAENYPGIYLYKRVVQAKLFIDAHFDDPLDLGDISNEACFSKFHFVRLFKSIYGKTPHQYLTQVRMDKAKSLLQEGGTVTEACFGAGFASLGSFSSLFKKYTGIAPSVFQLVYRQREEQIRQAPLSFIPGCYAAQNGWVPQKSNFQEVT